MKILLRAYTQLNVGDDLFLHILSKRYPNTEFILAQETGCMYDKFLSCHNNISDFSGHSVSYKIMRRMGHTPYIDKKIFSGIDAVVYIGGSIFMENENDRFYENTVIEETKYCEKRKIPYYILSCNFGPYTTSGYAERMESCFKRCDDVCFRDTSSQGLFPSVSRYAPDAVFSIDTEKPKVRENVLGISLISYKNRNYGDGELYMNQTERLIREHISCGGEVELFCFCKNEGDCEAADELVRRFDGAQRCKISTVSYDGDLQNFVMRFISCEKIFAARFHGIMLALIYRIPLMMHIYSEKTSNVLKDMGIFEKTEQNTFRIYDLCGDYVDNVQKIWQKLDKLC